MLECLAKIFDQVASASCALNASYMYFKNHAEQVFKLYKGLNPEPFSS